MRKIICFLCVILVALSLTACGNINASSMGSNNASGVNDSNISDGQSEMLQLIVEDSIDLGDSFNGMNGCAVLYFAEKNQYLYYNENMCKQEVSPFSTFKIISALLGLQNGVIDNESSTMNYNGTQYPNAAWNKNLTLKEAFQSSCVWYFRQVIDTVGQSEVQKTLNDLQYGNCDITQWEGSGMNTIDDLNGFWLDSSLKISPIEQVQVLSKIFEGKSEFTSSKIKILKTIMLVDDNGTRKVYGKTGTGVNGQAWFVGFSEANDIREYFAVYLDDGKAANISGNTAKEIALQIIEQ